MQTIRRFFCEKTALEFLSFFYLFFNGLQGSVTTPLGNGPAQNVYSSAKAV